MGLKQAAADASFDAKKRRRVPFSEIDAGIEANDCIKIFLAGLDTSRILHFWHNTEFECRIKKKGFYGRKTSLVDPHKVSCKEEVDAASGFRIDPIDLNRFFGEDGKIYGYKDLKVIFHAGH